MSNREPLWFCHECHAEMRPLMVPDPVCASCHGGFVEKMENTEDDPREFAHGGGFHDDDVPRMPPQGIDTILFTLQSLMDRGIRNSTQRPSGPAFSFELRGPNGSRTVRIGGGGELAGPRPESESPSTGPPNMSTFLGRNPAGAGGRERPDISGALMAQYLMALLGQHDIGMFGMPENGRMGDYVFNQEALDQIITQIMENSNAHRPVPAPEETIKKLDREVLLEGSRLLELDCAVCKEQFKLETEDPAELVVITLPCKHPFHEPCIVPWLNSSGTCPVCRFALVPQPEHNSPPPRTSTSDSGESSTHPRSPNSPGPADTSRTSGSGGGGLFHSIFGGLSDLVHHNQHNGSNQGSSSSSAPMSGNGGRPRSPPRFNSHGEPQHRRSNSDPTSRPQQSPSSRPNSPRRNGSDHNVPGGWADDLD